MLGYYTQKELENIGFKHLGKNVKVSTKASTYNPEMISIDDNSRVDDFCILHGNVNIGKYVHISSYASLRGGSLGIIMEDFSGLAAYATVFTRSDDFSGLSLTNPTVPTRFTNIQEQAVHIGKHVIVGAKSTILPGAHLAEGTAIGAMTLVTKPTKEWGIYCGIPAKFLKERKKDLLSKELAFKAELENE